jgi:hypothetical protein
MSEGEVVVSKWEGKCRRVGVFVRYNIRSGGSGGYTRRAVPIEDLHQKLVNRGILASNLQHSRCAYASVGIAIAIVIA